MSERDEKERERGKATLAAAASFAFVSQLLPSLHLCLSLHVPCAAILRASASSSSVIGFALGMGLTAEAGSQAMEEIILFFECS